MLGSRVGRRLSESRVRFFSFEKILFDTVPVRLHRTKRVAAPQGWGWKGLDWVPLTAEGLPPISHNMGPAVGLSKPVSPLSPVT